MGRRNTGVRGVMRGLDKSSHLLKCNNIIYFSTVHECFAPVNALRIMGTVMTRHIRIFFFFKIKSGQFLPLLASQVIKLNFSWRVLYLILLGYCCIECWHTCLCDVWIGGFSLLDTCWFSCLEKTVDSVSVVEVFWLLVVQDERRARSHSESFSRAEEIGEAVGVCAAP